MRFCILLLAAVALAACGGDDDNGGTSSSSPAAATVLSSPAAAETRTATGAVPAATTTATASATRTATPTATTGATAPGAATAQSGVNVTPALLALDDLPAGWTQAPSSPESDEDAQICDVRPSDDKPLNRAKIDFARGQLNAVSHSVASFAPGQAEAAFNRVTSILSRCTEWTDPDGTRYRLATQTAPRLGDQSYAFRLSADTANLSIAADLVYIRRGDLIASLGNIAVGQGSATADPALTEQLARRADQKLAAIAR